MDRYAQERYNPTLPHCGLLALHFDGHVLAMETGARTLRYPAVSGRPINGSFDYSWERQGIENVGPIPEGVYWIRPDELWEVKFWRRLCLGLYSCYPESAWGRYLIRIHPFTTTDIRGRKGGFTIHGGSVPGSAGCIDLTSEITRFATDLAREAGRNQACQIHLTVKYR